MWECFLWHFPCLERIQWVLDGLRRGPVEPPGPLELARSPGVCITPAAPAKVKSRMQASESTPLPSTVVPNDATSAPASAESHSVVISESPLAMSRGLW